MKIDLYFDVPQLVDLKSWDFAASSNPIEKIEGWTRYKVSVDVPDPHKPDVVLVGELTEVEGEKE